MFKGVDVNGDYLDYLRYNLKAELKGIHQPWFINKLFPGEPVTICKPLFEPFSQYAVTHTGIVFQYIPLKTIFKSDHWEMNPDSILPVVYDDDGRPYVTLTDPNGFNDVYYIDRLILDRFFDISVNDEDIFIEYLDHNPSNPHIANIEAWIDTYQKITRKT